MNALNDVVISGLGISSILGYSLDRHANLVFEELTASLEINETVLSEDNNKIKVVDLDALPHTLTKRQLKKIDRFTVLSIAASKSVISDSKFNVEKNSAELGLLIGNVFGGWSYVENQMYELCKTDMESINPYVATAWFPAAPQGEISILEKISGFSKTFSAGFLSSGYAIEYAYELILNDKLKAVIAGGVESPITTLVYNSLIESGEINSDHSIPISEGSGLIMLEKRDTALERGCNIYATIKGFSSAYKINKNAIDKCLAVFNLNEIDLVVAPSSLAMQNLFADRPVISFDHLYGITLGADFALNVISACLLMRVPNTANNLKNILVVGNNNQEFLSMLLSNEQVGTQVCQN